MPGRVEDSTTELFEDEFPLEATCHLVANVPNLGDGNSLPCVACFASIFFSVSFSCCCLSQH